MKIAVDPADIVEIATHIRNALGFDHAESVAGTDYPKDNQIEVILPFGVLWCARVRRTYNVFHKDFEGRVMLPSLINVFRSVEYHERETFEMLEYF